MLIQSQCLRLNRDRVPFPLFRVNIRERVTKLPFSHLLNEVVLKGSNMHIVCIYLTLKTLSKSSWKVIEENVRTKLSVILLHQFYHFNSNLDLKISFLVSWTGHFSMNISWPPLISTLNVRQPLAAYESKLFALTQTCLNVPEVVHCPTTTVQLVHNRKLFILSLSLFHFIA